MVWLKHKKSLTNRLLLIIVIAVIFNLLLSSLLLLGTGAFRMIREDSYEDFATTVAQDARRLSLILGKDAVNGLVLANNINQHIERLAIRNRSPRQKLILDDNHRGPVLELALGTLKSGLDTNDFTGAFLLLYDGGSDPAREAWDGVYLRRKQVGDAPPEYILERGPRELAAGEGLQVSDGWQRKMFLPLGRERSQFLKTLAGRLYDHNAAFREDGYWTAPIDLLDVGDRGIFYTIPLLGNDHRIYAVLGIEMSVSEVRERLLPAGDGKYAITYFMVPATTGDTLPAWHISNKSMRIADGSELIDHFPKKTYPIFGARDTVGEFDAEVNGKVEQYASIFRDLQVYTPYSPYAEEGYGLVGFAKRGDVQARYSTMLRNVLISILASTALVALLIYLIAKQRINRIVDASRRLHGDTRRHNTLRFKKVDIEEIDTLTSTLEELHKNVRDSALRMSTILDMLETPIGCYEYPAANPERAFVTPSLNGMLGLAVADESMSVDMEVWRDLHRRLTAKPCEDASNIYEWRVGDDERNTRYFRVEEVVKTDYVIGVVTDVTGQTMATKELRRRASFDELTHLHNRHSFRKSALRLIEGAPEKKGVMLFGDLDGLKQVNDEHGHSQGDRLIQAAAETMRELENIGGVASRLSGDEFAAYVHGFDSVEEARTAVYSCLSAVPQKRLKMPNGSEKTVSMSRGIAVYPDDSDEFSTLLSCADRAMYQAKYSHKGSLVQYGRFTDFDNETLHRMQNEVMRMVEEHRFYYVYQPVFSIETGFLTGYAVYIRPRSQMLSDPRVALEMALMMNLQERVGAAILNDNLALLAGGEPAKPYRLLLKTMKYSQMDEREFLELRDRYGAQLKRVDLLIPADSAFNISFVEEKVRRCRMVGAGVVFEHFGNNLPDALEMLELNPDMVRIDFSQVRDASRDIAVERVLERIINSCKVKRVSLLASGIESEVDYVQAKRWGFDMVQGYYLGYPGREFKPPSSREISAS